MNDIHIEMHINVQVSNTRISSERISAIHFSGTTNPIAISIGHGRRKLFKTGCAKHLNSNMLVCVKTVVEFHSVAN